jgi:hypothetical protein
MPMTDRRKKPAVRVDVLLHFFSWLIGAVTIILLSIAAVSLLGIGKEPATSSALARISFRTPMPMPRQFRQKHPRQVWIQRKSPRRSHRKMDKIPARCCRHCAAHLDEVVDE